MSYNRKILPRFDKCIEIMNSKDNKNKMIDIKIWNNSRKIKNATNDFHKCNLLSISKRDLMTVSASTE